MDNKNLVKKSGASKKVARLLSLCIGLAFVVGGVLGIVHLSASGSFGRLGGGGANSEYAYAATSNSHLFAWGQNNRGQLGTAGANQHTLPSMVGGGGAPTQWRYVSSSGNNNNGETADNQFTMALDYRGHLWIWGDRTNGRLGDGSTSGRALTPQRVVLDGSAYNTFISISAGRAHALAVRSDGTLWAWGSNGNYGRIGNNSTNNATRPVMIGTRTDWAQVSAAVNHSLGLTRDGVLFVWGENNNGQLGSPHWHRYNHTWQTWTEQRCCCNGGNIRREGWRANNRIHSALTRSRVPIQLGYRTSGTNHTYSNGQVQDWANWRAWKLGLRFNKISVGASFSMGILRCGALLTWGTGADGRLGTGNTHNRGYPVHIMQDRRFTTLSTGSDSAHAFAIDTYGRLWGWGLNNSNGMVGNNTTSNRSTPVHIHVPGATHFRAVSTGRFHTLAICTNGRLWAWGTGSNHRLGTGNTSVSRTPTRVRGVGDYRYFTSVAAGRFHSFAIERAVLNQVTGVHVSGNYLRWNGNSAATSFQVRRAGAASGGTSTHIQTTNNTHLNLNHPSLAAGQRHYLYVVATGGHLANSAPSARVGWNRAGQLATPTGVAVSGSNLVWTHARANTTHFEIRRGNYVLATVPVGSANAHSFDLRRLPNTHATGTQVGAYRALAVGAHSLTVVARNTTAGTLWQNSAASGAVTYNRVQRVNNITVTAPGQGQNNTMTLTVAWPRPLSVEQMPSVQLSAAVSAIHGTNTAVTWSSSNPSVATVDPVSGFVRATWPENMWTQSQLPHLASVITARSVFDSSVYNQFTILIVFASPPYSMAVGVAVAAGGLRQIELPADGSALYNVTQFSAQAYGFNLTSAMLGVTWTSSDTSVATIDRYTGILSALSAGVTRITATSVAHPHIPSAFYVTVVMDGTAIATDVTIFCGNNGVGESRLTIAYDAVDMPFVDLLALVEGHNIGCQLVTWTSSCGASVGVPSEFLSLTLTADGIRVTGFAQAGPIMITATPVNAVGAVGTFRIFIDRAVAPSVTSISVGAPSNSLFVLPLSRPIADMPSAQLTAVTIGGVGGGSGSGVVWTSSCGARAGVGLESVAGEFVEFVLSHTDANVVSVRAVDRGLVGFIEQVVITATSVLTPAMYASRTLTIEQPVISEIVISKAMEGHSGQLTIPYGNTEVGARAGLDLRALVGITNASVASTINWVSYPVGAALFDNVRLEGQNVVVTARPVIAGLATIRAVGAYCGVVSNEIVVEILQESVTSVRIRGPLEGIFEYRVSIDFPRPDMILLPVIQLGAFVGGSHPAAYGLVWTSSCGGSVLEFLGSYVGNFVMLRALEAGVAVITATHEVSGFYGVFTIIVEQARLDSVEILGDGVVREQTAMLIPLVYADGVYSLPELAQRQVLTLSLGATASGNVSGQFVWTTSDERVVRMSGGEILEGENGESAVATDLGGFISLLPYGVGRAVIRAVSTIDPSIYAEFVIYVTRGTASCNIQDGILDLPSIAEGDIRVILVCEHYFGTARMEHRDMSLEYAQNFTLPTLQLNISGAIFLGWSLSRGGEVLQTCEETEQLLLPLHLLDLEYGADTILLFAVWYIPAQSENGSNLARNIIIGTLSVAGVGAAGTAGYIAQSKIRARRKNEASEWGLDN